MEFADMQYSSDEIDLLLLIRKMLSYKALIGICLIVGIVSSLVWGLLLYKPSYDMAVSYTCKVSTNTSLSNMYGIRYLTPDDLVAMMNHTDTVAAFLNEAGYADLKINEEQFLNSFNVKYDKGIISVIVEGVIEKSAIIYKEYVEYCINSFNQTSRAEIIPQLKSAKSLITDELSEVKKKVFETETAYSSNFSYSITLSDRIKTIDTQIAEIEEGAIRIFSNFEMTKESSRAKTMIIITLAVLFLGAFVVFLICFFDNHIYFSEDITDIPPIGKRLMACIPLYKDNNISDKEYLNIMSKLPDGVSTVSVSEISDHTGAKKIANGLQRIAPAIKTEYTGSLVSDADILSDFSKYSINLIVLRCGIDTVNQVRNIIRDCRIKGVDNYLFVIYGLEPSDKMITRFEDDARYVKYSILSYRTLRQHYRRYYNQA